MPLIAAVMFERDGRRQRPQPVGLREDLGAESRVRLDHLALALVERARLLTMSSGILRLADVVQQRRFDQRRDRRLVERRPGLPSSRLSIATLTEWQ